MPLLGDGAAGLTQIDPGASAWLAQTNADLLQINMRQPWASIGTSGETIEANRFVFLSATNGKLYKGVFSDTTKRLVVGFVPQAVAPDASTRVIHMGRVDWVSGFNPGVRVFLNLDGGVSDSPGDGTDAAKRLVVGMQWNATQFLVNCLLGMSVF